jgi:hypothetical protein
MLDNEGADAGKPDKSGSGAPEGGSPEGGSENDDKPITAKQLKAALESQKRHYEGQLQNQRAEFEAFKEGVGTKQAPAKEAPKVYSKAELKAAVDGAQITQEQADEIWGRQFETQITEKVRNETREAVAADKAKERIDADLAQYKRLAPEILDQGSDEREQIVTRFKRMVSNGLPNNLATELAAIEAVLGPLDKLERARGANRNAQHDEQTGGSGGDRSRATGKKLVDQLSPRQKAHYQKGIDSRRYKDWTEVEAELKYSPARVGRA